MQIEKRKVTMWAAWGCALAVIAYSLLFPQGSMTGELAKDMGTIKGTVRSSDGNPLYGIQVKAKGEGKNYSTTVISDANGKYEFPPLPLGAYHLSVGTNWQKDVQLSGREVTQDFSTELGSGLFNQTSGVELVRLLPGSEEEKKSLYNNCGTCHSAWRMFASPQSTSDQWAAIVKRMATITSTGKPLEPGRAYRVDLSEKNFNWLVKYLTANITPEVKEKHSAETLIRPTGEAARAVFTEWELPKEVGHVTGTRVDSKGIVWFTVGELGAVGRLDPRTNDIKIFRAPVEDPENSVFHDLILDKEENVWVTGAGISKIVKFDTKTSKFTLWDVPKKYGERPHTHDFDPDGHLWFTMESGQGSVVQLDPKTGEMTGYPTLTKNPDAYGLVVDKKGTVWFTELQGHKVATIDRTTGKVTEFSPPTPKAGPRRIQMDSKGKLWFTEFFADKIAMLDPETMKFSEYDIGMPGGHPYFMKVDKSDKIWFNVINANQIARFDPQTKQFTWFLYPAPGSRTRDASFDYTTDAFGLVLGGALTPVIDRMYIRP